MTTNWYGKTIQMPPHDGDHNSSNRRTVQDKLLNDPYSSEHNSEKEKIIKWSGKRFSPEPGDNFSKVIDL